MKAERWRQVEQLYHSTLEREPGERRQFLDGACSGDDDLRREVESLLDHAESGDGLLERPAWERPNIGAGDRLGPYEIQSLLGTGGMGEVFRARDSRLGRTVAVKVLSRDTADPETARERLRREAKAISRLTHPHICSLYDIGWEAGVDYLVMEFLEGVSLERRLGEGALGRADFFRYAIQIADAIDHAHRNGVIHRDLKPANVMLARTAAGTDEVKLLDFGLAVRRPVAAPITDATVTLEADLTASGVILGTLQYMSPEQLAGEEADERSDIFALGAVLFEMFTRRKVFAGPERIEVLAAIKSGRPSLGPTADPALERLILKCLAENPDDRWQSARDLRSELEWLAQRPEQQAAAPARGKFVRYVIALLAAAVCLLAFAWVKAISRRAADEAQVVRLAIPLPDDDSDDPAQTMGPPAVSPDGKSVAVALGTGASQRLWLRRFDATKFEPLSGTEGALQPFWSPDSRRIGYFGKGNLMQIPAAGGAPQIICPVTAGSERGGAWSSTGAILYGVNYAGLFRVSDRGGPPEQVAGLDKDLGENSLRNPAFLPDGKRFIYFSRTVNQENRAVYLDYLGGGKKRRKLVVSDAMVALGRNPASGLDYLLFAKDGKVWAQRLDADREEVSGEPVAISEEVAQFGVSANGILVFRRPAEQRQYTWFDRTGKELGAVGVVMDTWAVELSPDDRRAAYQNHRSVDGHSSIWLIDLGLNAASPFSVQTERSFDPVWSRDSARVYFSSNRAARNQIFVKGVDDSGLEQSVTTTPRFYRLQAISLDGKYWLSELWQSENGARKQLYYSSAGGNDWRPLLSAGGTQSHGQFSPDGRWVVYDSNDSGVWEIYVTDFPEARRKQRISLKGGREPRWPPDGKGIVYYAPEGALMAVNLRSRGDFGSAQIQRMFAIRFADASDGFHYAVTHDGEKILAAKEIGRERSRDLNVVFNWPQLLRAAAP